MNTVIKNESYCRTFSAEKEYKKGKTNSKVIKVKEQKGREKSNIQEKYPKEKKRKPILTFTNALGVVRV